MSSILRNAVCAACVALLPSALAAQTETRVTAHAGMLPFTALHGGGQVEVTPRGGDLSWFAEYKDGGRFGERGRTSSCVRGGPHPLA